MKVLPFNFSMHCYCHSGGLVLVLALTMTVVSLLPMWFGLRLNIGGLMLVTFVLFFLFVICALCPSE